MPDEAFRGAPPSPNVEDRREEFSEWQHMLMALGIPPVDNTDNARLGMQPGAYLDPQIPIEKMPPPTALGKAAGVGDVEGRYAAQMLGAAFDPVDRLGPGPEEPMLTHLERLRKEPR